MIYCDTSLMVTAMTSELGTERAQDWLAERAGGELCISDWVITEFSSALAIKLRHSALTVDEWARAHANWRETQLENLAVLPVPQGAFDLAARFCDRYETGLRGGDALHLAVASLGGHALATLDQRMREGALAVGVRVEAI